MVNAGSKNGVAVQIKEEEIRALYTHCYTHSLNLAVGDTMNACPVLKDTIKLTKPVKMSPKRDAKLKSLQHEQQSSVHCDSNGCDDLLKNPSIKLFCRMRWTVRVTCFKIVILNLDELQDLWDRSLKNCTNSELKAHVLWVKVPTKTFAYIFGIQLAS